MFLEFTHLNGGLILTPSPVISPLLAYGFSKGITWETLILVVVLFSRSIFFTPLRTLQALFHHLSTLGPHDCWVHNVGKSERHNFFFSF